MNNHNNESYLSGWVVRYTYVRRMCLLSTHNAKCEKTPALFCRKGFIFALVRASDIMSAIDTP